MLQFKSILSILFLAVNVTAKEYNVSNKGNDTNPGTIEKPFLTFEKAADIAFPGDTITVHEGINRERINPPRGGISDDQRIVYQAAKGEEVADIAVL